MDKETREAYWQCMNLNCGTVFVTHTYISQICKVTKQAK
ncbi:ogr/Delta-like zinc finger family protein [Vibrio furnissii]